MALDYTVLQAVCTNIIEPKLQDNLFTSSALLNRLKKRVSKIEDGGLAIQQPIIYAESSSVGTFSGTSTILTDLADEINAVTFQWGHYYRTMGITYTDELANSGKTGVIKLVTKAAQIAEMSLFKKINTDLHGTTATNGVEGLENLCKTTTDFGGISSSDASVWAASLDSSSTTLTVGLMQGKFGDVSDGEDKPDLLISNQDNFDKWYLINEPKLRVGDNGTNALKFGGADYIVDASCPGTGSGTQDNHLYFLNTKYLTLYIHSKDNFKTHEWQKPLNQMVRETQITATLALGCSNRRRQGAITTLDPAL